MPCSSSGRFGCDSTLGYVTASPVDDDLRVDQGRADARGATLLTVGLSRQSLFCASNNGLVPFGSNDTPLGVRSSEGSEVMASSTPVDADYRQTAAVVGDRRCVSSACAQPGWPLPSGKSSAAAK